MTGVHPYSGFLHKIEKPARYVGGEYNAVVKERVRVRMCLAFPDVYDIGMSHLGTKILYSLINRQDDKALERAYAPWFDMEHELRRRGLPLLSLETARPLVAFDVVGFSLQYEMTYTNVLTMLELGGIPLRCEARRESDPLVIAGGPCATHPEPMAPFMDLFVIGDAERALPTLLDRVADLRDDDASRRDMLMALSSLDGVYAPSLYETTIDERSGFEVVGRPLHESTPERVKRDVVEDINDFPFPSDSPEPVAAAIFDRVAVEIARGCTEGCRFCQAGMIYRPVREREPQHILDAITEAVSIGGYDEASLSSLSTADYSCISPLIKTVMQRLRPEKVSLSVSSLRAYGLEEELLDEMASVRATGLTFAPEAGSQRLRDVINKNITEEDILTTCDRVFERGWKRVKLYFMIGLPTETDEDVAGIAHTGRQVLEIGRRHQRGVNVTVSVSSHVPKPHTPFQWCAMDSAAEVGRKQRVLADLSRKMGLKLRVHDVRVSILEGILARGDRRSGDLIELAWSKGARFDSWDDYLEWDLWQEALAEWESNGTVSREDYLATLPVDGRLPWDHIDVGLADGFLLKEYRKALAGRLSPPCGKPVGAQVHHTNLEEAEADKRKLVCYHCGVACDLDHMRRERLDKLRALDATSPVESSSGTQTERERAHERFKRGLSPREFDQGDRARYRLHYAKLEQAALLGHLDIIRMLPRIFRRAGLELGYSEGFHPKPLMSFGPALALGIRSVAEYVDIRLVRAVASDELLERLNGVSPQGLRFLRARRLDDSDRKLSKVLAAQDLLLTAPQTARPDPISRERLAEKCESILAQEHVLVTRERKGKTRTLDLRQAILELETVEQDLSIPELGSTDSMGVRVRIRAESSGPTPKPKELAHLVFDEDVSHADMARVACWIRGEAEELLDPLEAPD